MVIKMTKKKMKPPVKISGGKFYLTSWIIENFPSDYENLNYFEPMCSNAFVFLNKKPSKEETLNDLDTGLICIFKSLRDEPEEFINKIKNTNITEDNFKIAQKNSEFEFKDYIDQAVNEFILRKLSRGGLKKTFHVGETDSWNKIAEDLSLIAERIKNCIILNNSALDVIKFWDEEDTFCYLDAPQVSNTHEENYEYEMSVEDHIQLIELFKSARGKVMISGQSSPLYNRSFKEWRTKKKNLNDKDGKVEILWMNY